MVLSPAVSPRKASRPHDTRPTITLADAILGRNLLPRRSSVDRTDRAAVTADIRRERTKLKAKKVDIGESLGPYDTDSVRDRVRQWQAHGGGVVEQYDPIVSSDTGGKGKGSTRRADVDAQVKPSSRSADNREELHNTCGEASPREGRKGKRVPFDMSKETASSRDSSTAPKKRVVSDRNWMNKKHLPASTNQKRDESSTSTPLRYDDGIRVTPIKSKLGLPERQLNATRTTSAQNFNDNGIRVYSTPREKSQYLKPTLSHDDLRRSSGSQSGARSDEDRPSSRTTSTPPRRSKVDDKKARNHDRQYRRRRGSPHDHARGKDHEEQHISGQASQRSPRSPELSNELDRRQPRSAPAKTSIMREVFDEGKRMFTKPEPPPARPTHGSRIEAWLSETPDPFLDGPSPVVDHAELAEAALIESFEHAPKVVDSRPSTSSQRRRKVEYSHSVDQVAISAQQGSVGSSPEPKKVRDVIGEAPNSNLQTMRRAGAKRSATSSPRSRKGSTPQRGIDTEDNGVTSGLINTPVEQRKAVIEPITPRAPPPNFQRHSPSTGLHQLSTIASVETLSIANEASVSQISQNTSPAVEGNITSPQIQKTSLKRRLTKHADLISVLSMPRTGAPSLRSARSIRTSRSRTATATLPDLMKELRTDEDKYMREVNTLVDGVIPVLLSCVMSKSKSAIAAGLFDPLADPADDASITRSIVDMGIALERLKSLHKRIPREDPQQLLHWAQGAQRVYRDYLQSWRMGFQDVIVNLAPANGETESLIGGLPRNKDGDVINGDGERVDVAFLLKRPLVRLKYLAKTFKGINRVRPSLLAEEQATIYHGLVTHARTRSNEERAKLEDHNADSIDPTRARDPRTLAPLVDATIERGRHVRARDYFSLELQHSSGQRVDCKVELLLRDAGEGSANAADLLICEVDASSRWLLFPPINTGSYSARHDDRQSELVVMIRGQHQSGQEWHELLSLRSEDEQAASDWVQMLGLVPEPPSSSRRVSFIPRQEESLSLRAPTLARSVIQSRTPSPTEVDVPIGELSREQSKRCRNHGAVSSASPPSHNGESTDREMSITPLSHHVSAYARLPTTPGQTLKDLNDAMAQAGGSSSRLRRNKATRQSRPMEDPPISPRSPHSPRSTHSSAGAGAHLKRPLSPLDSPCKSEERGPWLDERDSASRPRSKGYADLHGNTADRQAVEPSKTPKRQHHSPLIPVEPENHRRTSLVPSMDLPTINKLRKAEKSSRQQEFKLEPLQMPGTLAAEEAKASPNVLRKSPRPQTPREVAKATSSSPSPTTPTPVKLKDARTPRLRSPKSGAKSTSRRRSSSPLKHQYEPSTASATSESDESSTEKEDFASSDSSSEEELEDGDAPTPLLPLGALHRLMKPSPKASLYSLPNGTLTPSQSASQAPYKTVPQQAAMATKTIASIFMWSERGSWDRVHPNECSIVIIPGLIEAYEMSAAHSEPVQVGSDPDTAFAPPRTDEQRPLIGLELTPLVPLRRGTALDISIRSPPTASSQIRTGNNVMFRSRNPEECEMLYHLINQSRIHNPTYIALQNARGPYGDGFGPRAGSRASARRSGWWGLGGRQKSYRAATTRGTPSFAASDSSVGSMSSAFSALRRFGTGGRMFNIARSSVSFGGASRPQSVTSSETSGSSLTKDGTATPPDVFKGSPIGLSNTKIRLYQRETASKWRDMGSARLSITRPPANHQGKGFITGQERRVVVHGKTAGETLLDVCLGEAAFERVARTGIALSIWEEIIGPNGELGQVGAVGGVSARTTVYMIQLKSEAETAYTFSLVGKQRY